MPYDPHLRPFRPAAPQSEAELLIRAEALAGRSAGELAAALGVPLPPDSRRGKGFVGQLVERALGADPCAGERPDFSALSIELKTVPVDAGGRPRAATFCCSVELSRATAATWATSRLRQRLACVLWLPVHAPAGASVAARRFGRARLWRMDPASEALLRADWEELMGWIGAGLGASLGAERGTMLQVRPKAAHARARVLGPGEDGPAPMLPLGFYLRPRFTAALLLPDPERSRRALRS